MSSTGRGRGSSGSSGSGGGRAGRPGRPARGTDAGRGGSSHGSTSRGSIGRATSSRGASNAASRGASSRGASSYSGQSAQRGQGNQFRSEERSLAKGLDGMQVEGRIAVRELLLVGRRRVKALLMAEGTDDSPILREIEALADRRNVAVRYLPKELLLAQARTEAPQGVIARCAELEDVDPEDLLVRLPHGQPQPFILAIDGLTDPGNLGALLRTAQGAGVTGVVIPKHRSVHITPTVAKAAAGAIEHLPIAMVTGLPSFLLRAKDRGAWVVGLDAGGDSTIYGLAHFADQPLIVVIGSEGDGLSRLTRERCDVVASIPLRNGLESLNASVAGAVALFELGRHRPLDETPGVDTTSSNQ